MSEKKLEAKAAGASPQSGKKIKEEYGSPRPEGVAGPNASYVEKSLNRWRARGNGLLR